MWFDTVLNREHEHRGRIASYAIQAWNGQWLDVAIGQQIGWAKVENPHRR